jgi:pectinesterase
MAAVSPRVLLCAAAVALLLVASSTDAAGRHHRHGHTKKLRPGAGKPAAAAKPYPVNATTVEAIERQFTRWVRFMGGLGHSASNRALNRAFLPARTVVVDKNRRPAGGFSSIQAAVDSLPLINLARVVIRVNAGTYTYVQTPLFYFSVSLSLALSLSLSLLGVVLDHR